MPSQSEGREKVVVRGFLGKDVMMDGVYAVVDTIVVSVDDMVESRAPRHLSGLGYDFQNSL